MNQIIIENKIIVQELWRKGHITYELDNYQFWLVESIEIDETVYMVHWFSKLTPKEVRRMEDEIIETFKKSLI